MSHGLGGGGEAKKVNLGIAVKTSSGKNKMMENFPNVEIYVGPWMEQQHS
jgi:hypothetical protein